MSADRHRALLGTLIDDAGLFPPAGKAMDQAIADHVAARSSDQRWILGRFLCPLSRLEELEEHAAETPDVGVVFDVPEADWGASVQDGLAVLMRWPRYQDVSAVEMRLPTADPARSAHQLATSAATKRLAASGVRVFLEVPGNDEARAAAVDAVARAPGSLGLGAKLRLGGVTVPAFPSDETVAAFIEQVRGCALAFKATAGLHHPFRIRDTQLDVLQHGFINLLAATALTGADTRAVIAEADPEAFRVTAAGLSWRDQFADLEAIGAARELFTAFGSCSFREPIEDLTAHRILAERAAA